MLGQGPTFPTAVITFTRIREQHMEKKDSHKDPLQPQDGISKIKERINYLLDKEQFYMDRFKFHHKIIFAFTVFFGINLVWYGIWEIISITPFIKNPIVATIIGSTILIVTGYFYENMISADFDKRKYKKRIKEE